MKTKIAGTSIGWGVGLLLLGVMAAPASAQPTPIPVCGTYGGGTSYIVTADLSTTTTCIIITGNGATIDLNSHSIRGVPGSGAGIIAATPGNNMTIKGPGIVHDFGTCIQVGNHALVADVLVYNCEFAGIRTGNFSKCVECRVHDVRTSEPPFGVGITMGLGCLLESSIVETSDVGVIVGNDCKVWDLVVDGTIGTGLAVGRGTSVARTVISHYHDGPGLDYTNCGIGAILTARGCQDSSNSVSVPLAAGAPSIVDVAGVTTDCATNKDGTRYQGNPITQCPNP